MLYGSPTVFLSHIRTWIIILPKYLSTPESSGTIIVQKIGFTLCPEKHAT